MHDKLSLKGKEKNNDLKLSFLVKNEANNNALWSQEHVYSNVTLCVDNNDKPL